MEKITIEKNLELFRFQSAIEHWHRPLVFLQQAVVGLRGRQVL